MARKFERVTRRMTPDERAEMQRAAKEIAQERDQIIAAVDAAEASKVVRLRVTDEMHQALQAYCESAGTDLSTVLRDSALQKIGRKDLIGTMPGRGRPRPE